MADVSLNIFLVYMMELEYSLSMECGKMPYMSINPCIFSSILLVDFGVFCVLVYLAKDASYKNYMKDSVFVAHLFCLVV